MRVQLGNYTKRHIATDFPKIEWRLKPLEDLGKRVYSGISRAILARIPVVSSKETTLRYGIDFMEFRFPDNDGFFCRCGMSMPSDGDSTSGDQPHGSTERVLTFCVPRDPYGTGSDPVMTCDDNDFSVVAEINVDGDAISNSLPCDIGHGFSDKY